MTDSEELYCLEVARRSVARAALYLGIDSMSQDSLDVLADVLQAYVGRIGRTLSHLVETSGRPSNHVNALDAIKAIHLETAPAANHVGIKQDKADQEGSNGGDATTITGGINLASQYSSHQRISPWHDLAVFCYGPKWEGPQEAAAGVGGKQGPSSTSNKNDKGGWRAPYNSEEVPQFPETFGRVVANPHRLQPSDLTLHSDVAITDSAITEEELKAQLDDIPDRVFGSWGTIDGTAADQMGKKSTNGDAKSVAVASKPSSDEPSAKRSAEENLDADDGPPKKKAKLDSQEASDDDEKKNRPSYLSVFMPAFPQSSSSSRAVVVKEVQTTSASQLPSSSSTSTAAVAAEEAMYGVRSSLVNLDNKSEYWGSSWDAAPTVPLGRGDIKTEQAVVVPLNKPSNARVSRILEGSMDTAY